MLASLDIALDSWLSSDSDSDVIGEYSRVYGVACDVQIDEVISAASSRFCEVNMTNRQQPRADL